MGASLKKMTVKGFKSIRNLEDFELKNLNLLIGGNGAGKSNFVGLFRLLSNMTRANGLKEYVAGTADDFLFGGAKTTKKIVVKTFFGQNGYEFELAPTVDGFFLINNETTHYYLNPEDDRVKLLGSGSFDARLLDEKDEPGVFWPVGPAHYIYDALTSWKIYHFHDTSQTAGMRRYNDCVSLPRLDSHADKIAPFLYFLRDSQPQKYSEILHCARLATPFLDDFILEPNARDKIRLDWRQKGLADYSMSPSQFSDGSIRFICLATALLQPKLPSTLVIDEPEIGLHPAALGLLAELIQDASRQTQLIVATQSAALLDHFTPEDVVVVNRKSNESTFERLDSKDLKNWLENYSLGELWSQNVLTGGPVYE